MVIVFWNHVDPRVTLRTLDQVRLRNQLREAIMIREGKINPKHPAAIMWEGFGKYLDYFIHINKQIIVNAEMDACPPEIEKPAWTTSSHVVMSHRARLIKKEPAFYEQIFGKSLPAPYRNYGYVWPTSSTQSAAEIDATPLGEIASPQKDEGETCECGASPAKFDGKCFRHRDMTVKRTLCDGTKKDGTPCRNKATFGLTKCGVHNK